MDFKQIAVIGAGTMGKGIAQWFAQAGASVELTDQSLDLLKKSKASIFESWDKLQAKGKFTEEQCEQFKKNITVLEQNQLNKKNNLVIEAIFEDLEVKKQLFSELDEYFDEQTCFATNTSSFSMKEIGEDLNEKRQSRFYGLHFFNPAPIMKLVEIIQSPWVDQEHIASIKTWLTEQGKIIALCKDSPGFIVNRVARNFYGEAFRIVQDENPQRMKELDKVLREVGGFRMGPFELMDLIGVDINYAVTVSVWEAFRRHPRFSPHSLQKKMVDEKRFGKKSGRGFYEYE